MQRASFGSRALQQPMQARADTTAAALPQFERRSETLDNGLRTHLARLPHLQSATVSFLVRSGSRYETEDSNGLSHLLEHMLYRGTKLHRSAHEFSFAIEKLAGSLDACTHVDFTQFDLTLPPENVLEGIALLADFLCAPILDSLGTEKEIIKEELLEDLDEGGNQIDPDNVARRLVFPDHPLGFPIPGSVKNLQRFGVEQIRAHLDRYYTAKNSALCVSGPIGFREVADAIRDHFAPLPEGAFQTSTAPEVDPSNDRFIHVHHADSQTHVRLCFPAFGVKDRRVMALHLLERILDDGLSARLHHTLCDQRGLAYDAFADADLYEDSGVFDFGASVEHGKVPELIGALLEVIDALRSSAISESEIAKARTRYIWDLRTLVDHPEDVNGFFGTNTLFDLPDTPERLFEEALAVDSHKLTEVARVVLDQSRAHLACVGVMEPDLVQATRAMALI